MHILLGNGISIPRIWMEAEDHKNLGLPLGRMCQGNSHCVNIWVSHAWYPEYGMVGSGNEEIDYTHSQGMRDLMRIGWHINRWSLYGVINAIWECELGAIWEQKDGQLT